MKNSEIFQRNPYTSKLLNDGVAAVSEGSTQKEIDTLRYELEHFVCEGQYKEGIIRILESFIGNVGSPVQPAAWVSGFFGSGKSHLLKMLRHLWVDTRFADGATARGLVQLPAEVADLFKPNLGHYGRFDKFLLDPPREGAISLVHSLPDDWPRRIVYVSCDPATLARDADILVHHKGFELSAAGVVNMFPHTAHVESIPPFERN